MESRAVMESKEATDALSVKLPRPEDAPELLALHKQWHEENGLGPWVRDKVEATIARGINQQWAVIGVIRDAATIHASIGLYVGSLYYSDDEHIEDLWNFVLPLYRRSTHAKKLLRFARDAAAQLNRPLLMAVIETEQTAAKARLFERELGKPSGSMFVVNARPTALVAA